MAYGGHQKIQGYLIMKTIDEDKDIKMTLFSLREHIYFTPTFKDSGVTAEKGTERGKNYKC